MLTADLKKYFWDVQFETLDIRKHKKYILERILELGDDAAVAWMRKTFGNKEILDVLRASRTISPKSLNFWNLVLRN